MERFFDRVAETKLYALEEPYEEKLLDFKTFHLRNFFGLLAKSFRPGCYCSTFPGKIFRYKHFFEENHVVFEYLWKFFSVFGRNFSSKWSKLYFTCREEHFSWKNLLKKKLDFFQVRTFIFSLYFWRLFFGRFSQFPFYVSTRTFWAKTLFWEISFFSFSDLDRVIFEVSVKTSFVSLVKTAFHVSRATVWSKLIISRNKDSTTFWPWMKNILTCWWKTPALLAGLHSPFPATIRENFFLKLE